MSISEKRHQSKRIQKKRASIWKSIGFEWTNDPRVRGQLRKNHFGCGCSMCKPWKNGRGKKYKISERKKLNNFREYL